jgi:hypothetical protein
VSVPGATPGPRRNPRRGSKTGRRGSGWAADDTKVSKFKGWNVPDSRVLFIGSFESSFRIDKIVLTPVSGTASLLR